MDIKCIALDLDQTTLNQDHRLSAENRKALELCICKGIHIVIASGRAFDSLPADVLSIPGIEYAITSNGAAVYYVPDGARLHGYTLTPQSVEHILQLTAAEPITYEVFIDGIAYGAASYVADPIAYGTPPTSVEYIQRTRRPVPDMLSFIREHIGQLDSLDLVVRHQADKERLSTLLRSAIPNIYVTSSVPQLVEISHKDAGKHSGVRFVAECLGLTPTQIAAFGDGDNDADMLRYVGCGIAVANASPACLAAADFVTPSFDQNGVAHGIHHILKIL